MNSKRCFLALVDLLGFSNLAAERDLGEVASVLRRFQSITRAVVSDANKSRLSHGVDRERRSRLRLFSDLILVHTEGDSHDDCMDIVEVCSRVFRIGCQDGLLPRGAVAWGDMIVTSTLVVGPPLVEAHFLESQQEWAGISLCNSMHAWDSEEGRTGDGAASILGVMEGRLWLVRWPVPTTSGDDVKRLAINWLTFDKSPYWHSRFTDLDEASNDARTQVKLQNTETFYRHVSQLEHEA